MKPTFKMLITSPVLIFALGFGAGLSPKAPGTVGTLIAVPLYFILFGNNFLWNVILLIITFSVGVGICHRAGRILQKADHSAIVWDEMVGFWLTMVIAGHAGWLTVLLAFALFRLFDITKPWPIKTCDTRLKSGLGVMLDDVLAAVYAGLVVRLIQFFI